MIISLNCRYFSFLQKYALIPVLLLAFCPFTFAQESTNFTIPDSLKSKTYEELQKAFDSDRKDSINRYLYANTYIAKATREHDSLRMTMGYELMGFAHHNMYRKSFSYYDKAIEISKNLGNTRYPSILYTYKGAILSTKGEYQEALENHLKAIEYAETNEYIELVYINKHNIGLLKMHLELYEEALDIFKECYEYELNDPDRDELDFLHSHFSLADIYTEIHAIDSALKYNTEGYKLAQKLNNKAIGHLFQLNRGIIFFHEKEYEKTIEYVNNNIDIASERVEKRVIVNGLFHAAKAYDSLQQKENAILYYKKADSVFTAYPYNVSSTIMNTYKALYNHYRAKNDKANEVLYIEKALQVSDINKKDYRALSNKIIKTFDRRKLLEKQKELNETLNRKDKKHQIFKIIVLVVLIIFVIALLLFYAKQRQIKKRFQELIKNHEKVLESQQKPSKVALEEVKQTDLADDVISQLLASLQEFEEKHIYIKSDITLPFLAKRFKTNSAYLSKVINTYKNKKFAEYLNDLRVDYAIEKIQTDKHFRLYTVKAIAIEVGFNNSQSFARAFKRKTGIKPSDFVKQLESIHT